MSFCEFYHEDEMVRKKLKGKKENCVNIESALMLLSTILREVAESVDNNEEVSDNNQIRPLGRALTRGIESKKGGSSREIGKRAS